jgi:hypothetical protein
MGSLLLLGAGSALASGGGGPPPDPWTPDEISGTSLAGWWDASDAATITTAGGTVSAWNDKSANANNLTQGFGPAQPDNSGTLNGLATVAFAGAQAVVKSSATGLPDNSPGSTILAVMRFNNNALTYAFNVGLNFDLGTLLWGGDSSKVNVSGVSTRANNAGYAVSVNTWQLMSGTITTTLREIFLNGASQDTDTATDSATTCNAVQIGSDAFGNAALTGVVAEVVLLSGTDTTDRQLVEGYLAWKWGLEGDLDAGHPYKSAAPTV